MLISNNSVQLTNCSEAEEELKSSYCIEISNKDNYKCHLTENKFIYYVAEGEVDPVSSEVSILAAAWLPACALGAKTASLPHCDNKGAQHLDGMLLPGTG